jgi:uncharacterized FlaG/YvyC family protein
MAIETAANIIKGVTDKANGNNGSNGTEKAPIDPKAPAPVVDPNAGKEKYIVDGQERWLTPDQARAYVQKGISFEPKMDQLGRLQHETAAFLQTLQDDPAKVIYNERFGKPEEVLKKLLGSTKVSDQIKETLGQWYYDNVIVPSKWSPEQQEAHQWRTKAQEQEAILKQQETERLTAENNSRVDQALQVIKSQINEAMKEAGVPLESRIAPQLARRVAQVMQSGYRVNRVITPKEAMGIVRREVGEYQKAYYDALDEDKLVEQLGKENAEKVRKYYLKAVKDSEKEKPKKDFRPSAKRDERKTMTPDEFRDYLDDLKRGK